MAARSKDYDMQIKLLTIGNSGVGKTCLLLRYGQDTFSPTFITTIGIDFKVRTITIDDKRVKLQIWDTAGQERFRTITTSYFRGAQGIVLVYDVTDRDSFENVRTWMQEISKNADKHANVMLVGNKCDMEDQRKVSKEEGEALAREQKIPFVETSAKSDINVTECFYTIAKSVKERLDAQAATAAPANDSVKVSGGKSGKKDGCC